jgi:hypothetical protein
MPVPPAALFLALAFSAAATAGTAPAGKAADPGAELRAAFAKSSAAASIRITTTYLGRPGLVSVTEMQRPDRLRSVNGKQPATLVIGEVMYMQVAGRYQQHPFPRQPMAPFFDKDKARRDLERGARFELVGNETLGDEPARVYRWTPAGQSKVAGKLWLGARSGFVLQEEVYRRDGAKDESTRARFDRYNAVRIDAPKP